MSTRNLCIRNGMEISAQTFNIFSSISLAPVSADGARLDLPQPRLQQEGGASWCVIRLQLEFLGSGRLLCLVAFEQVGINELGDVGVRGQRFEQKSNMNTARIT
jgi:hypothetical protein